MAQQASQQREVASENGCAQAATDRCPSGRVARSAGGTWGELLVGGRATQMAAHVADEIRLDAPLHETPVPLVPLEAVVVPTADDWLQRQVGQRLQRGEVRTRDRCASVFVDVDREIRGDVL